MGVAGRLLAQLPRRALLLGDWLYGVPAFIVQAWAACHRVGSHFLLRVPRTIKTRVIATLPDGSCRVRVALREKQRPWHIERLSRSGNSGGGRAEGLSSARAPLVDQSDGPSPCSRVGTGAAYADRWEHELYFREAKRVLRQTDVLQSHTIVTAAQEIAAIVLATGLLARERARAATGPVPALRVKFGVVLAIVRSQWFFLGPCEDLLTARQKTRIVQRGQALMRRCVTGPSTPSDQPSGGTAAREASGPGSCSRTRSRDRGSLIPVTL